MAAGAFELDLATPVGVALRSGGGPILIDRRFITATGADTFPKLAGRAVFYGVGGGGWAQGQYQDGGGGAFSKRTIPCAAGGTFNVQIGAGGQGGSYGPTDRGNDGQHTFVTVAGVVILKAAGGNSGTRYLFDGESYYPTPDGRPGSAADCIGDVRISGTGRLVGNGVAGDRLFVPGPQVNGSSGNQGVASFPGCGGISQPSQYSVLGAAGLVIAEFWSA